MSLVPLLMLLLLLVAVRSTVVAAVKVSRPRDRSGVSLKQRYLTMTCVGKLTVKELGKRFQRLHVAFLQMTVLGAHAHAGALYGHMLQIRDEVERLTTYDDAVEGVVRVSRSPNEYRRMLSIQSAMQFLRNHVGQFEHTFGFTPLQVLELLQTGVVGNHNFHAQKRGSLNPEGMLLLLLGRMSSKTSTVSEMSSWWGVDAAFASAFAGIGLRYVLQHWGHLLDFASLQARVGHRLPEFRHAMAYIYSKAMGYNSLFHLPGMFKNCCFALDGVRSEICRPTVGQREMYNKYVGFHNLGYIGLVGPDSLVYALTEPSAGRANDPGMVMQHNVNLHLSAAHLPGQTPARALCDSAFGYSPFLSPLPRRNQALYNMLGDDRRRALSASRIIVEWAFGEASMLFPYIEGLLHMKIFQTRPGLAFRVAHLFLNFKHCMVGANATLYGECFPPTLQTYMV